MGYNRPRTTLIPFARADVDHIHGNGKHAAFKESP